MKARASTHLQVGEPPPSCPDPGLQQEGSCQHAPYSCSTLHEPRRRRRRRREKEKVRNPSKFAL